MSRKLSFAKKAYHILLLLVAATIPFKQPLTPILIAITAFLGLFLLFYKQKFSFYSKECLFLCITYFLVLLLGLVNTSNLKYGLFVIEKNLSVIALPLAFTAIPSLNVKSFTQQSLLLFTVSSLSASITCLVYALVAYSTHPKIFRYSYFTNIIGVHPAYFSIFMIFSFFIILTISYENRHRLSAFQKGIIIFTLFYMFIFIIFLKARMPVAIFFASLITGGIIILTKKKELRNTVVITFIVLTAGTIVYIKSDVFASYRFFRSIEYGLETRLQAWEASLDIIKRNLIFGVGTGDVHNELNAEYKNKDFEEALKFNLNSHNQYLENWVRNGFFGFAILLLLIFRLLYCALKKKMLIFIIFITIFALFCLTESALNTQKGLIFFIFFASLFNQRHLLNEG